MKANISNSFNWELIPQKGLGNIPFGLNITQINIVEDIVGKLNPVHNPLNQMAETYELLKGQFPEEELKKLMEQLEELSAVQDINRQEFRNNDGLCITYENGMLMDFYADDRVQHLHLGGIPVFSSDPLYLVEQMASILAENPVAKDVELVFFKNHIYLYDFLKEDGTVAANKERTVSWRNSPRILGVSLDDYKELAILNI